jgi:hypothetical protein
VNTLGLRAACWRKSKYSGAEGGQCVEVADLPAVTNPAAVAEPDFYCRLSDPVGAGHRQS